MHLDESEVSQELYGLILNCASNDRFAQSRLYSLLSPKLFGVCLRYSKNREEAEDILQEGFIRIFKYIHRYRFIGSFHGWARKIMINCAIQNFRSRSNITASLEIENIEVESQGFESISSELAVKELLQIVQNLPPRYRMVFNLFVIEGYSHREIAKLLSISEGTSKSNLFDARLRLRQSLNDSFLIKPNRKSA